METAYGMPAATPAAPQKTTGDKIASFGKAQLRIGGIILIIIAIIMILVGALSSSKSELKFLIFPGIALGLIASFNLYMSKYKVFDDVTVGMDALAIGRML
jgi:hypothetical protein